MQSSSAQLKPLHLAIQRIMDAATPSNERGSGSPTTAANTFAATARDDWTGLIGMGASGTGALRCTTKVAWGGVSGGILPSHRNGGGEGTMRGTAALIGMSVMPWNPGGCCAYF